MLVQQQTFFTDIDEKINKFHNAICDEIPFGMAWKTIQANIRQDE